jgi:integrase
MRSHATNATTLRKHLLAAPLAANRAHEVTSADITNWLAAKQAIHSAKTVNNLRGYIHAIYVAARESRRIACANPVERVKRMRVNRTTHDFLRPDEASAFLAALPGRWRPLFATAIYQALRKGELIGLCKSDVDLDARLLTVARSYGHDTTKGGHADVIPIHEDCLPELDAAIAASTSELVFPRQDGQMFSENTKFDGVLKRALCQARIVLAYDHRRRRGGYGHAERHTDDALRRCPSCGMKLWSVPIPRKIRFHDLRHTTASLLVMSGASPASVQRILRHTDPKITMNVYAHLTPEYLRSEIGRLQLPAGTASPRAPKPTPVAARVTSLLPASRQRVAPIAITRKQPPTPPPHPVRPERFELPALRFEA